MMSFALVDAFTDRPFTGNTAGVVSAADGLSNDQMQRIARELGQTETCFVSSSDVPEVDVDLCGHATVAAFTVLAGEGRVDWSDDRAHLRCATRTGAIGVWLERMRSGSPRVMMSIGVASLEPATEDWSAVAQVVGLAPSALDVSLPLVSDRGS